MNTLIRLTMHDGDNIAEPKTCAVTYSQDTTRTVCGYALDGRVEFDGEVKRSKRGGITCTLCLKTIKEIKDIKL